MDKHGLIGFILMSVISSMSFKDIEEHSSSACFQQPEKTLLANCTLGQMVKINDIFFGHSSDGQCSRIDNNSCIIRDPEIPTCVGHSTCAVNLPTGSLGRKIQHCNQYTNYMQMLYNCVPGDGVVDICSHREITARSGYIKSSHYPNNYPATHQCNLTIKAKPTQQIRLFAIDLDLGSVAGNGGNGGDCIDLLYIEEQFRSSTVCGKRNNVLIFTTVGNTVTLTFQSNKDGLNKGFWLKFEAFPQMESTTTQAATHTSTVGPALPNDNPKITGQETEISLADLHNSAGGSNHEYPGKTWKTQTTIKDQSTDLPLEGIVGGILGTLFFILLVLLILLIIKRRKDRESMSTSHSTAQLHSSASSTSAVSGSRSFQGTAGPYIQNNLAEKEEEEGLQGAVGGSDISYDDDKCKSVHFDEICKKV